MATTGFWPVKGSLKAVIEYADNPDKTTENKYLDSDLAKVVQYAANDAKTDKKKYVSGIHCTKDHAYEDMLAVQKRFGLRGSNVAYHGFQSFKPDEVTPEEAHQIGIETAQKMWGDRYQVLVTTHLNTDSVHNHIVVNAVSYVDGKKFQNHIGDHIELRKISDRLCLEHGLSILQDAPFYGGEKKAYWIHKNGGKTHRDILKEDIEECIKLAWTDGHFIELMEERGYEYDYTRHSIKAPSWERGIRLDRMGYSRENILDRIMEYDHLQKRHHYVNYGPYQPKSYNDYPLLQLERELGFTIDHSTSGVKVAVSLVFYIVVELLKLMIGEQDRDTYRPQPISPELRLELAKFDELNAQTTLLGRNHIDTLPQLEAFIEEKAAEIQTFEKERQQLYNGLKTAKSHDSEAEIKSKAKDITERIRPLRKDLKTAKRALERSKYLAGLVQAEHNMEVSQLHREQRRNMERDRGWER